MGWIFYIIEQWRDLIFGVLFILLLMSAVTMHSVATRRALDFHVQTHRENRDYVDRLLFTQQAQIASIVQEYPVPDSVFRRYIARDSITVVFNGSK